MNRFKIVTLGCKVNQYESEYLREGLLMLGWEEARDDEPTDLCIVNTCTVTGDADQKSRKYIRHLARVHPQAELLVTGCYATRSPAEVARLPGVTRVITDKSELPNFLRQLGLDNPPTGISGFGRRHRAFVKVQDGCALRCSYCIIPSVRQKVVSRPVDEILEEIRRLLEADYREIVLTGIHLGHYGIDFAPKEFKIDRTAPSSRTGHSARGGAQSTGLGGLVSLKQGRTHRLVELLERILTLGEGFRIRLSSLEAVELSPELLNLMKAFPTRICHHLHLPMQSGSDRILARMRRRWAAPQFVERCLAVQAALHLPALTTDVMVGFPGETAEDFEATRRVIEAVRFAKLHVFRFSPREGTPAMEMPDQIPGYIKQQRAESLINLGEKLRAEYISKLDGSYLQVLVENVEASEPGSAWAMADRYVPVLVEGGAKLVGELVTVKVHLDPQGRLRGICQAELDSAQVAARSATREVLARS